MTLCHSITSLIKWGGDVRYLNGDETLPYVERDGCFHYFAFGTLDKVKGAKVLAYVLVMTSTKDLGEANV